MQKRLKLKKVQEAAKIAKDLSPELAVDGELQFDAAFVPETAEIKALIVMLLEKQMFLFSQTFNQEILAIKLHNVWVCLKQSDRFYKD